MLRNLGGSGEATREHQCLRTSLGFSNELLDSSAGPRCFYCVRKEFQVVRDNSVLQDLSHGLQNRNPRQFTEADLSILNLVK